jgi:hypothetical protein
VAAILVFRSWIHAGYIRLHRDLVTTGAAEAGVLFSGGPDLWRLAGWKILKAVMSLSFLVVSALPAALGAAIAHYGAHASQPVVVGVGLALLALVAVPVTIYVALGLVLGDIAVVIERLGPVGALERSWSLARGNRVPLFVYFFVTTLFSLVGVLACCIGVIVTRAIADLGTTEAYLLATHPDPGALALPRELGT